MQNLSKFLNETDDLGYKLIKLYKLLDEHLYTSDKLINYGPEVDLINSICLLISKDLVGTEQYNGMAYFWNHAYRHQLRDATFLVRRCVHNSFLERGLALDGESKEHEKIIDYWINLSGK